MNSFTKAIGNTVKRVSNLTSKEKILLFNYRQEQTSKSKTSKLTELRKNKKPNLGIKSQRN